MNKVLLLIIGILIITAIVLYIAITFLKQEIEELQSRMRTVIDANNHLHEEIKKMSQVDKIKSDNRKEANEKINNLYNGDSTDNAIDVLRNNDKR